MRGFLTALVCLLALQAIAGTDARFLLDLKSIPMPGRHLTVDSMGSDPTGADTRGADPAGAGSSSGASAWPFGAQALSVTVAQAPSYAAPTTIEASPKASPRTNAATLQARTHGSAPTSAPAGESAPSVPTLNTELRRRLVEDTRGSDPKGADTKGADTAGNAGGEPYAHAVFKQPTAAPVSAQSSAGGPVPLSTILYSKVPKPGKPTLATAPTTAPGGAGAPSSAE